MSRASYPLMSVGNVSIFHCLTAFPSSIALTTNSFIAEAIATPEPVKLPLIGLRFFVKGKCKLPSSSLKKRLAEQDVLSPCILNPQKKHFF